MLRSNNHMSVTCCVRLPRFEPRSLTAAVLAAIRTLRQVTQQISPAKWDTSRLDRRGFRDVAEGRLGWWLKHAVDEWHAFAVASR